MSQSLSAKTKAPLWFASCMLQQSNTQNNGVLGNYNLLSEQSSSHLVVNDLGAIKIMAFLFLVNEVFSQNKRILCCSLLIWLFLFRICVCRKCKWIVVIICS